jgi:single-strand DNA-binding protein
MGVTVTGKLNKPAKQFQAGDSLGFGVQVGVKFYDREAKADAWTNYSAVIFAKAPAQIKFYQEALVEGAIIEVSGDKCKIRQFQGNNGLSLSIEILDAKLGAVYAPQQAPQQPSPAQHRQQQHAPQRPANQPPAGYQGLMPQHNQQAYPDFEDDIPFAPIALHCQRLLHCM